MKQEQEDLMYNTNEDSRIKEYYSSVDDGINTTDSEYFSVMKCREIVGIVETLTKIAETSNDISIRNLARLTAIEYLNKL